MAYTPEYVFSLKNHDIIFTNFNVVEKKLHSINSELSNKNGKRNFTGGKNTSTISRNYNNSYNGKKSNNNSTEDNGWRTINKDKYKSRFNSDNNNNFMKIKINEILNKLSNSNFETTKENLKNLLDVNNNNYDSFAVEMLFINSIQQPLFCKQYVNMLDIIKKKEYIEEKYNKYYECVSNSDEDIIHKKGYTSFIVEMYNNNIITKEKMSKIALDMLNSINTDIKTLDTYVEHILIIFKNANDKKLFRSNRQDYIDMLTKLSKDKTIPSMQRFKLMGVITELE